MAHRQCHVFISFCIAIFPICALHSNRKKIHWYQGWIQWSANENCKLNLLLTISFRISIVEFKRHFILILMYLKSTMALAKLNEFQYYFIAILRLYGVIRYRKTIMKQFRVTWLVEYSFIQSMQQSVYPFSKTFYNMSYCFTFVKGFLSLASSSLLIFNEINCNPNFIILTESTNTSTMLIVLALVPIFSMFLFD